MLTEEQLREIEANSTAIQDAAWYSVANQQFTANARTWIPQLLALVREQERLLTDKDQDLENMKSHIKDRADAFMAVVRQRDQAEARVKELEFTPIAGKSPASTE